VIAEAVLGLRSPVCYRHSSVEWIGLTRGREIDLTGLDWTGLLFHNSLSSGIGSAKVVKPYLGD
jgi:hypothetical protein